MIEKVKVDWKAGREQQMAQGCFKPRPVKFTAYRSVAQSGEL